MDKIIQKYAGKLDSLQFTDHLKFENGYSYKGFWKQDLPFGPGVVTDSDGNTWGGELNENGLADG